MTKDDVYYSIEELLAIAHYPVFYSSSLEAAVRSVKKWPPDFVVKYYKVVETRLAEALLSDVEYVRNLAQEIMRRQDYE